MGQETFGEFLRDNYPSHKWDIGAEDQFKQLAQTQHECDLTPLFEERVYAK